MADKPISDLPVASAATTGDFFVINKANTATQRIEYDNFIKDITATGSLLAPLFYNFLEGATFDTRTLDDDEEELYSREETFTMPEGADAAVIITEYVFKAKAHDDLSEPGVSYCRFGKEFVFSGGGATVIYGTSEEEGNRMTMGTIVCFPHEKTSDQDSDEIRAQGIQMRHNKTSGFKCNPGATFTVTSTATHILSKKINCTVGAGRIFILPYKSSEVNFQFPDTRVSDDPELNGEMPAVTPEETEANQNDIIRGQIRYLVDQTDNALRYDDRISASDKVILEAEVKKLYALAYDTNLASFEASVTAVDNIRTKITSILRYKFNWQTSGRASLL